MVGHLKLYKVATDFRGPRHKFCIIDALRLILSMICMFSGVVYIFQVVHHNINIAVLNAGVDFIQSMVCITELNEF